MHLRWIGIQTVLLMLLLFVRTASRAEDGLGDSDGDGFPDALEEASGSDPRLAQSVPRVNNHLVGHWGLDDGQGLAVADATTNALTGKLSGQVLPVWDEKEGSLVFDGVQNYVEIPDAPPLRRSRGFAVTVWVKADPHADGVVVGKWPSQGLAGSYSLGLVDGHVVMELSVNGHYCPLISEDVLPDDGWHQLAAVYDEFEMRLYLNGRKVAATHPGGPLDEAPVPLLLGLHKGRLADVRLYDRGLNDRRIAAIYQVTAWQRGIQQRPEPVLRPMETAGVAGKRLRGLDVGLTRIYPKDRYAQSVVPRGE